MNPDGIGLLAPCVPISILYGIVPPAPSPGPTLHLPGHIPSPSALSLSLISHYLL